MPNDAGLLTQREIHAIITELEVPSELLGEWLMPDGEAMTDQFIIQKTNIAYGLADPRAEDAEAALKDKDDYIAEKIASVVDWSNKVRLSASDVKHTSELAQLPKGYRGVLTSYADKEKEKEAKEIARLRRMLDYRREWLQINAVLGSVAIATNGVKFTVDYGIPAGQKNQAPGTLWGDSGADPILNIQTWQETVYDACGITPTRMAISLRIARTLARNAKWARNYSGQAMEYMPGGFKIQDALDMIKTECNLDEIKIYDGTYATRNSNQTRTFTRFLANDRVILLPSKEIDGNPFAQMVSTPHPENDWQPGFYSWTKETKDPWGRIYGVGKKMLPVIYYPETIFWADVL